MTLCASAVLAGLWLASGSHLQAAVSTLGGHVTFSGVAVPGATVTASRGGRTVSTTTSVDGEFRLGDMPGGSWTVTIEMPGFVPLSRTVTLPLAVPLAPWALVLRPLSDISSRVAPRAAAPVVPAATLQSETRTPGGGGVITGSAVNGAASRFAQPRAFGNNRPKGPPLYNFSVTTLFGNSAWNAHPFSFNGSGAPAPASGDAQVGFNAAGPLRIPRFLRYGPQTVFRYEHGITHETTTRSGLVPTAAERLGDFGASGVIVTDPLTGHPFPDAVLPPGRISPQAASLLAYYPLPNAIAARGANYQAPVLSAATQESLQLSMNSSSRRRSTLDGALAFQRTVTDTTRLFGFVDSGGQSSLTTALNWSRRLAPSTTLRLKYQFARAAESDRPFFAGRTNVSGDAGIAGNDQNPANWGPPALLFPDIADLRDAQLQRIVTNTHSSGGEFLAKRGGHNLTIGADRRWHRVDGLSQPDSRGTLTFTGAASGQAWADFLLGLPSASAIAFGSAPTRLRAASYDAYVSDDWRPLSSLTLSTGVRWEYETPFTEAAGRLANLDIAPGFTAVRPVVGSRLRPDRRGLQPRVAASWRPSLQSPLVIRASYGIYRNLGVYPSLAWLLAQQPPFSKTFNLQTGPTTPLTLANPFPSSVPGIANTAAVDPDFRSGDVHTWQASAQREMPASLTLLAAYFGARGVRLMQALLPNTYPAGAANPCPDCPSGFVYVTSHGSSLRNAAQFTLRRRLHNGFTSSVQYTLAKATDDAATFANKSITASALAIAQNWQDPSAERAPSTFDQRHLVSAQLQYTTGVGVAGGTLVDSVWASIWKNWTVAAQLTAGSGLPFTPVYFAAVGGSGIVGVRPSLTGMDPAPAVSGSYANPAAFVAPSPGTWGNAGRNSIRGPRQFALDASVARAIRLRGRLNLEWRVAATNVLNRVTFGTINAVITSPQFGLPTLANSMRTVRLSTRLRF